MELTWEIHLINALHLNLDWLVKNSFKIFVRKAVVFGLFSEKKTLDNKNNSDNDDSIQPSVSANLGGNPELNQQLEVTRMKNAV